MQTIHSFQNQMFSTEEQKNQWTWALVDKEFVLSLHHKLHVHVLKWVNVSTNRMMYTNTINQLFTQSISHHKQQWNLPPWWNYLQVFIQRRSLIRQNRIRQILPFNLRPLTAHVRMEGTYRAWLLALYLKTEYTLRLSKFALFTRRLYRCIMFKAARTPTLLKAGTTLSARAVPSAPLFLPVDSNVWKTVRFWSILNSLSDQIWDQTFCLCYQQRLADSNV